MGYYDTLVSAWNSATQPPAGVSGTGLASSMTTQQKLTAINGWTVPGPHQSVTMSQVIAYLGLNAKLSQLQKYAASAPATSAGVAASELVALFGMGTNTPVFNMSDPTVYATVSGMLSAIAGDSNSGITTTDATALLALANTTVPWWQSVGYTSGFNTNDLAAAGGLT